MIKVANKLPSRNPILTSEGKLHGGRSLWLIMITPHDGVGMGSPHIWPQPGLTD